MILEKSSMFKCLRQGDKTRARHLILYSTHGHRVKCIKCDQIFVLDSTSYRVHLLFTHGFYADTCKTNDSKKREWNILKGLEVRQSRKLEKQMIRVRRRNSNLTVWSYRIRFFFDNLNYTAILVLPPTRTNKQDPSYTRTYKTNYLNHRKYKGSTGEFLRHD